MRTASGPGISCHSLSHWSDGVTRRDHILADAVARCWILQTFDELAITAVMRPGRNESGKIVEPCGIGVSVCGDIETLRSGSVYLCNDFRHAPPAWFAADLQVPDFDGDMALAADAQSLVEGRRDAGAFVAQVGGVNAAEFGSFPSEGDQLFGFGVGSGSVFERSRDADGAVAHGLAHKLFHLLKLDGRGLDVVVAEHHASDARSAHIAGNVDSNASLLEPGEVFPKRPPVGLNAVVIVLLLIGAKNGVVQRGDGFALAGDFRGYPLENLRRQAGVDKDGVLRLSEHVDETGSNNHVARIDGASAWCGVEIADEGNLPVANSDIARIPGRAGAIDDAAVGDDDIEGLRRFPGRGEHEAEQQDHTQE